MRSLLHVEWALVLPALAAFGLYSVVYVERRYLAPFTMLLLFGVLWSAFQQSENGDPASPGRVLAGWMRNVFLLAGLWKGASAVRATAWAIREGRTHEAAQVASGSRVAELVGSGARIAVVGDAVQAIWERFARARIVAFVPPADAELYWRESAEARKPILDSLRSLRVALIVADTSGSGQRVDTAGWSPIPGAPGFLTRRP